MEFKSIADPGDKQIPQITPWTGGPSQVTVHRPSVVAGTDALPMVSRRTCEGVGARDPGEAGDLVELGDAVADADRQLARYVQYLQEENVVPPLRQA